LERQTAHLLDDERRIAIALVETRITVGEDNGPTQLLRSYYAFNSKLFGFRESRADGNARIILNEEYRPYGRTSYLAEDKWQAPKGTNS